MSSRDDDDEQRQWRRSRESGGKKDKDHEIMFTKIVQMTK